MEKIFFLKCRCGWNCNTTGTSEEIKELGLAEYKKCAKCGGPRKFKCKNCGQIVKMIRRG
jgi:hypothetical protein